MRKQEEINKIYLSLLENPMKKKANRWEWNTGDKERKREITQQYEKKEEKKK